MVRFFLILTLLVGVNSCMRYIELHPTAQDPSKKLRIDGVYYKENINSENELTKFFIFYLNGVVLVGGDETLNKQKLFTQMLYDSSSYMKHIRHVIYAWGIYKITDSTITIEAYESPSGGKIKTLNRTGRLINDTTIIFHTLSSDYYFDEIYTYSDTFHFRKFSPKPDSTNEFIKSDEIRIE